VDEHLVFPIVRVQGGVSSRRNLEDSHAEILCPVILANHDTCRYSFHLFVFKVRGLHFGVLQNLQDVLRESCLGAPFQKLNIKRVPVSSQWIRHAISGKKILHQVNLHLLGHVTLKLPSQSLVGDLSVTSGFIAFALASNHTREDEGADECPNSRMPLKSSSCYQGRIAENA
jgi:hypothetical protein